MSNEAKEKDVLFDELKPEFEVGEEERIASKKEYDQLLGTAINTALEMDVAFKLYSFRIINQDMFLERVRDLSEYYQMEFSNLKKSKDGNESENVQE